MGIEPTASVVPLYSRISMATFQSSWDAVAGGSTPTPLYIKGPNANYTVDNNIVQVTANSDFGRKAATAWSIQLVFDWKVTMGGSYGSGGHVGDEPDGMMWIFYDATDIIAFHQPGVGNIVEDSGLTAGLHTYTVTWAANDSVTLYDGATIVDTGSMAGALPSVAAPYITAGTDFNGSTVLPSANVELKELRIWQGASGTPAELSAIDPTCEILFPTG